MQSVTAVALARLQNAGEAISEIEAETSKVVHQAADIRLKTSPSKRSPSRVTAILQDDAGMLWEDDSRPYTDFNIYNAMESSKDAAILVETTAPFKIVAANVAWQELCGFGAEAIGQPTTILHGEKTDLSKARRFRELCVSTGHAKMSIVNYHGKTGRAFCHAVHTTSIVNSTTGRSYFLTQSKEVTDIALRRALLGIHHTVTKELSAILFALVYVAGLVLIDPIVVTLVSVYAAIFIDTVRARSEVPWRAPRPMARAPSSPTIVAQHRQSSADESDHVLAILVTMLGGLLFLGLQQSMQSSTALATAPPSHTLQPVTMRRHDQFDVLMWNEAGSNLFFL